MKLKHLVLTSLSILAMSGAAFGQSTAPKAIIAEKSDAISALAVQEIQDAYTGTDLSCDKYAEVKMITSLNGSAAAPHTLQVFAYDPAAFEEGSDLGSGKLFTLTIASSTPKDLKLVRIKSLVSLSFIASQPNFEGADGMGADEYKYIVNFTVDSKGKISNKAVLKSFKLPK